MRSFAPILVALSASCGGGTLIDASAPVGGAEASAHVVCEAPKKKDGGVPCQISHDSAGRCAICWVVQLDCKNGRHLRVEACDEIAPGTESARVLDDIPDRARCDVIESGAVVSAWTRDCSA